MWATARRTDVGVFYFEWERNLPFVPFFILPYLSIDLFFIAAPFLLPDATALTLFVRRVALSTGVAGLFFLFLPLRFAFPRPAVSGWTGGLFDWFRALDAPVNLFPSLHAALCLILVDVYARYLRGFTRAVVLLWFGLIALSPLFTHQHHVIDILGGGALAVACFLVVRPKFLLVSRQAAGA